MVYVDGGPADRLAKQVTVDFKGHSLSLYVHYHFGDKCSNSCRLQQNQHATQIDLRNISSDHVKSYY